MTQSGVIRRAQRPQKLLARSWIRGSLCVVMHSRCHTLSQVHVPWPGAIVFALMLHFIGLFAGPVAAQSPATPPDRNLSFRHEIQHTIDRGLAWLQSNQNSNGWWSTPDQPAVTALSLNASIGDPA
jgi:hypothetical protein